MWLNYNCSSFISMHADADSTSFTSSNLTPPQKQTNTKANQVVSNVNHEVLFTRTMAFEKKGEKPVKITHN